jgi:hypothetical protein
LSNSKAFAQQSLTRFQELLHSGKSIREIAKIDDMKSLINRAVAAAAKVESPVLPHGFTSVDEFVNFGTALGTKLKAAGYDDIKTVLHGSAVTGVRATSKTKLGIPAGAPFDAMIMSDFDIALVSPKLLARAKELGIPTRGAAKMRTGELWPGNLNALGIGDIRQVLSKTLYQQNGRKLNFMIFGSMEEALSRGPSIRIPGA